MQCQTLLSFFYDNDVLHANQIKNDWLGKGEFTLTLLEVDEFKQLHREGKSFVMRWIDHQLELSTVAVILLGSETLKCPYVQYTIQKSYENGIGLIGLNINPLKDNYGKYFNEPTMDFIVNLDIYGRPIYFSQIANFYCYLEDDGYNNLGIWIKKAALKAEYGIMDSMYR